MADCSSSMKDCVKQYYGKELKTQGDCQSGINCLKDQPSLTPNVKQAFDLVHQQVTLRYFGCGPVIPEALDGCKVLDLGSGSGRDCFAMSKLIGPSGYVIGIDMTEEQLDYARSFIDYHKEKFGYSQSNVEFRMGNIEDLSTADIPDDSFDLVISNCVICLCDDKAAVLSEAARVLKDGGELYFSDMYTDREVPESIKTDHVMWGEGLGGAMQWRELYRVAQSLGFSRPRLVTATMVNTTKFDSKLNGAKYVSVTYRLFKLPKQSSTRSQAVYTGGIEGYDCNFRFDHATAFTKDKEALVDEELANILSSSRFNKYFRLEEAPCADMPGPMVDPIQWAQQKSYAKQC